MKKNRKEKNDAPINKKTSIKGNLPKYFILFGIVLAIIAIFVFKNQKVESQPITPETAEEQLDRNLAAGKPVFAFIHSNNCQSCLDMIQTVKQVFPDFEGEIALIDVDVYDPVNERLLQRTKISYIPTQVFFDSSGVGTMSVGAMKPEDLKASLMKLLEGTQ